MALHDAIITSVANHVRCLHRDVYCGPTRSVVLRFPHRTVWGTAVLRLQYLPTSLPVATFPVPVMWKSSKDLQPQSAIDGKLGFDFSSDDISLPCLRSP